MKHFKIFFAAALITAAFTMFGACDSALNTASGRAVLSASDSITEPSAISSWTAVDIAGFSSYNTISSIAYGGGVFVAGAGTSTEGYVSRSTDGRTWERATELDPDWFDRSPSAIHYLNSNFLVTAGNKLEYGACSSDGSSWYQSGYIGFGTKGGVYADNRYLVTGQNGWAAYTSSMTEYVWTILYQDITTFEGTSSAAYINAAAYGNGLYVFGGGNSQIAHTTVVDSSTEWEHVDASDIFGDSGFVNKIAYGNNVFMAAGGTDTTGVIATSTDGDTWIPVTPSIGVGCGIFSLTYGVVNNIPYFAAGDDTGNFAYTTNNGASWVVVSSGATTFNGAPINDIAIGSGTIVIVGGSNSGKAAWATIQ